MMKNLIGALLIVLVQMLVIGPTISGWTWERDNAALVCELQYEDFEANHSGATLQVFDDGSACGRLGVAR